MSISATALISTACAIIGAVLGYYGFLRASKKESEASGKESGTILAEIAYIKSAVDDIKCKQDKQDERYLEIISRLVALESYEKQTKDRIDRLENREEQEKCLVPEKSAS